MLNISLLDVNNKKANSLIFLKLRLEKLLYDCLDKW